MIPSLNTFILRSSSINLMRAFFDTTQIAIFFLISFECVLCSRLKEAAGKRDINDVLLILLEC